MKESFTHKALRWVEPIIFGRRLITLIVLIGITLVLAYSAAGTHISAGYQKTIPLDHPYMQVFKEYYDEFGGANTVIVALTQKDGSSIYNKKFLTKLKKVTDAVFFLPGIDRARVMSIFTPNVQYAEVIEGGLSGSTVVPADYEPTQAMFNRIRDNVSKASIIGRLVSNDQTAALVTGELIDVDPVTGKPLDYQKVSHQLEKIRAKFETDNIRVRIIGFAEVVGNITDAAAEVVTFFLITLVLTTLLLWLYVGSFKLAFLPMGCSVVAVIWEFGLLTLCGYGLDPFAILVPFLVLAVSVSHGVQFVNSWVGEVDKGTDNYGAALETFRRLAIPGTTALITDVAGFLTIYLINIEVIREMAINAAFGVAAIIITNKMLMPIWLSYIKIKDIEAFRKKQLRRERMGDAAWRLIAKQTRTVPAVVTLLICTLLLGFSVYKYQDVQIGSTKSGVPELRPNARYNRDARAIDNKFAIGNDILKVIAEGKPDACIDYNVMHTIDRFAWTMDNTAGVQGSMSLLSYAKLVYAGLNEGRLNAERLPRNHFALAQASALVPTTTGLLNKDCSAMAVFLFTQDHKATTISHIVEAVKQFQTNYGNDDVRFRLATGNVGVMAATNEVIKSKELEIVFWVYAVILLFLWLSFRTLSGMLCVALPLSLVSMMTYALMAMFGIGMKVATLPVVALAVGIGVDYGIYIYSVLSDGLRRGLPLEEAFYNTLHHTGKAVVFTGIALGLGVATWLFSDLQFQVDMGLLLIFMFTANMFGAILVMPALARFFAYQETKKNADSIVGKTRL